MSCAQDVSATVRPIQSRHHQWIKADLTVSHNNDIDNNANEQDVRCGKANQWFCKQLAFHLKRLRPQKVHELPYYLTLHCLKTQGQVYKWSEICALKLNTIQGKELYLKVHCVKKSRWTNDLGGKGTDVRPLAAQTQQTDDSRKSDWLHAGKYFSPVSGKYSQQYHGKYYCCPLILYVLQIYTYDRPQIWSADKYLGRSHEITKSSNQEIMKC